MNNYRVGDKVLVVLGANHLWRDALVNEHDLTAEVPSVVVAVAGRGNTVAVRVTDTNLMKTPYEDGGFIAIDDTEPPHGRFYGTVRFA